MLRVRPACCKCSKGTLGFGVLGFLKLAEAVKPVLCFHSPESYHCWGQSPVKQLNPDSQARRRHPTESNALIYEESTTAHQQVPLYAFWDMSSPDKSLQFRNTFKGDVFQVFGHFAVESQTPQSSLNFLSKGDPRSSRSRKNHCSSYLHLPKAGWRVSQLR